MRSDERQRQILDCAKKVFAERGFHASNISHICAEAGIGRGTLYQYFHNKKSVFAAILRETLDRVQTVMKDSRGDRFPRPEKLRREEVIEWSAGRLKALLEAVFEDERSLRITLREAVGLDVDIEKILGEIDDNLIGIVEADLLVAQQAGLVRVLDVRTTATMMVGGIEKLALNALRGNGPIDLDRLALEAARFHGIGLLSERITD